MTEKDIYSNGVALLEEWEDVNYCEHSFKFKDEWLTDKEVVDLLNELDEKYVDEFALRETLQQELQRSEEENEQLKIRFNEEREKSLKFCRNIDTLTIENEQLKSTIKEVTELLSDEVDLFSDKATEHDINAYVELKELDNKDAYYMATATKKAIKMLKELQE